MKKLHLTLTVLLLFVTLLEGCGIGTIAPAPSSSNLSSPAVDDITLNIPDELLSLRFDGYESMTISEYREKAIPIIMKNETTYLDLIDQVNNDSKIQEVRYSNTDAYFALNILIPTIAQNWDTWRLSNSNVSDLYMFEYTISYTIHNADNITMGERNQAISSIMDSIGAVLDHRTKEELADEIGTQAALIKKINKLTKRYSTDNFEIKVDLSYRASDNSSSLQPNNQVSLEARGDIGTKADYQLLLSLKTDGYEDISVAEFLQSYVELAQHPDFEQAYARVSRDISLGDIRVDITSEEMDFLETTLEATSQEFVAKYQSERDQPTLQHRIEKQRSEAANGQDLSVFELFIHYSLTYSIPDDTRLTVGERDKILITVRDGVQIFVDNHTEDELLGGQSALEEELKRLMQQYSNNKMSLTSNLISYQAYDQRDDIKALH